MECEVEEQADCFREPLWMTFCTTPGEEHHAANQSVVDLVGHNDPSGKTDGDRAGGANVGGEYLGDLGDRGLFSLVVGDRYCSIIAGLFAELSSQFAPASGQ